MPTSGGCAHLRGGPRGPRSSPTSRRLVLPTSAGAVSPQQDLMKCVHKGALFHQLLMPTFTERQARQEHLTQSSCQRLPTRVQEPHRPRGPQLPPALSPGASEPVALYRQDSLPPPHFLQVLVNALCLHFNNFLEPNPTGHKSALKPGIHSGPQSLL